MLDVRFTNHTEARMRQWGFRKVDIDLVLKVGTRVVEDAFFLTNKDAKREIEMRRHEIQQLKRLRGSKLIIEDGSLHTLSRRPKSLPTRRQKTQEAVMKPTFVERTALILLPATVIDALLKIHGALDNDLASTLKTGLASCSRSLADTAPDETPTTAAPPSGKYVAEFLGIPFTTETLPEVFAEIVDMTAEVAPEALDVLSEVIARKRRFVARRPEAIHPGNQRLPVMQTTSGWWISKNIGQEDLKRAIWALCRAAGLRFGKDIKFPLRPKAA